MTERKYIQLFVRSYWRWWIGALIVGLIIGGLAVARLKTSYEGSVTFTIHKKPDVVQSNAPFYTYDGYYASQASVLARNSFAAWINSPKVVYDIYQQADATLKQKGAADLARQFTVSDDIDVTAASVSFRTNTEEQSKKVSQSLINYAKANYASGTNTEVNSSDPLILALEPPKKIIVVGVGLALTLVAFVLSLLVHYFQDEK